MLYWKKCVILKKNYTSFNQIDRKMLTHLLLLCDSSRDSDSSPDSNPFYSDSDSSQVFSLWLGHGLGLRYRVQAVAAVPSCAVYSEILWHYSHIIFVVCFHVLEDEQMLNMGNTRFVTRTLFVSLTRTRTLRWWLGLRGDDSDSDLTTWPRTQHWHLLLLCKWSPNKNYSEP